MSIINVNHKNIMNKLINLPAATIVGNGRSGTDFLHSLFDSHPEVLTFNGHFPFNDFFWDQSSCVLSGNYELNDLINELYGKYIYKFKSRYDIQERKDKLGNNEQLDIELETIKYHMRELLNGYELNSKNILIALTAAYELALNRNLENKKIILNHTHHIKLLKNYVNNFHDSKIICLVRDPRANIVSSYENFTKYFDNLFGPEVLYNYLYDIINDARDLIAGDNQFCLVRLENLGNSSTLLAICNWLEINYNNVLLDSTWGGLHWQGDRLSNKKSSGKFSKQILNNKWENKLSYLDRYIFDYLTKNMRKYCNYRNSETKGMSFFAFTLLFKPLGYELMALKKSQNRKINKSIYYYFKRVLLFFKLFLYPVKYQGRKITLF